MLGVSSGVFAAWRRKRGLPANRKTAEKGRKQKTPAGKKTHEALTGGVMHVGQLARIVGTLEAGHPDAVVLVDGRTLLGVEVCIRMDAIGAVVEKRVLLKTEAETGGTSRE